MMTSVPALRMLVRTSINVVSRLMAPAAAAWCNMANSPDTWKMKYFW